MVKRGIKYLFLISFVFLILFIIPNVSGQVLNDSLLNCYGGEDTIDIISGNDLTLSGAVINTTIFNVGSGSFSFNGVNDFAISDNNLTVFGGRNRTISTWIFRLNDIEESGNSLSIGTPSAGRKFSLQPNASGFSSNLIFDSGGGGNQVNSGLNVPQGIWENWILTTNKTSSGTATEVSLYRNGTFITSSVLTLNTDEAQLCLGGDGAACVDNNFHGNVDETAIWDRILTQAEITSLFNSGNGLTCSDLTSDLDNPVVDSTAINGVNFTEGNTVQINVTCSDAQLETIEVFNNETGLFISVDSIVFSPTVSSGTFIHNSTAVIGVIGHLFECSDLTGNSINSSILTYTGTAVIIPTAAVVFSTGLDRLVNLGGAIALLFILGGLFGFFKNKGFGK